MTASAIEIPHEQYQLDNGLNVILHHDDSLPQVVINLWYGVGSKDEEMGRSGFAHLFEHLMFMGTVHLPDSGFDELMEAHGGWNNAWTSTDATDYYEVGPSSARDLPVDESDRMRDLARAMTQEKLDLQRDVVRNERRQSVEDTPYGIIWEAMAPALYPADHPYGHTVIGTHEDLMAATVEDVVGFFERWYSPNNASLVVAGDFDAVQAKAWIEKYFGGIARMSQSKRNEPPAPKLPQKPVVETTDNVQIPLTMMVWHTPAAFQAGDAALDVVASILGEGRSSRLYADLITANSQAIEVSAWQYSQKLVESLLSLESLLTDTRSKTWRQAYRPTSTDLPVKAQHQPNGARPKPARGGLHRGTGGNPASCVRIEPVSLPDWRSRLCRQGLGTLPRPHRRGHPGGRCHAHGGSTLHSSGSP